METTRSLKWWLKLKKTTDWKHKTEKERPSLVLKLGGRNSTCQQLQTTTKKHSRNNKRRKPRTGQVDKKNWGKSKQKERGVFRNRGNGIWETGGNVQKDKGNDSKICSMGSISTIWDGSVNWMEEKIYAEASILRRHACGCTKWGGSQKSPPLPNFRIVNGSLTIKLHFWKRSVW